MVALIIGLQYCCTHFVVLAPQNNVSYIDDWHWAIWNKSHFVNVTIGRFEKNLHFFIYSVKLQKIPAFFKKYLSAFLVKSNDSFFSDTRLCSNQWHQLSARCQRGSQIHHELLSSMWSFTRYTAVKLTSLCQELFEFGLESQLLRN